MKTTIVESLDYGMALLKDGSVIKADGTIISPEEYAKITNRSLANKLDWIDVDNDEVISMMKTALWVCKTYESTDNPDVVKQSYALIDSDGEPYYLRVQNFLGADSNQIAQADYSRFIYQVNKNRPELLDDLSDFFEELFSTAEQVGSEFSPDDETTYLTKMFIRDGYTWKLIFKNNQLSNIKRHMKLHRECEVNPKNIHKDSVASKLATGDFNIL
jgi:hypothetical protein